MKKSVRRGIFYVVVLALLVFLADRKFKFISGGDSGAATTTTSSGPAVLPVSAKVIKPQSLDDKLVVTGTLMANEAVEITSEVTGIVEKIYFKEGSKIKRGDLLLTLNVADQEAQLEKLRFSTCC